MKKLVTTSLLLIFFIQANAQINFEKGYFINNNGEKTNCFIKNIDWKNNPVEFEYKSSESSEIQGQSIQNVKEFGVEGESKFVRFPVKINLSSDEPSTLEEGREVEFEDQTLFLKVLIEGDATLYYYENGALRRFFYSVGDIEAEQLVYKRFYYSPQQIAKEQQLNKTTQISRTSIGTNATYKQQLLNNLKCDAISKQVFSKISYQQEALTKLFRKYNECVDPNWVATKREGNKFGFNLSIRPGLNFSSLNITSGRGTTSFESNMNLRVGLEMEFILPFNKNKWALVVEPTYRNYQGVATINIAFAPEPEELDVDYQSIEFAAGVRYYAFLNDNSKISFSGYMLNDMELDASASNPTFINSRLDINPLSNFALGLGYKLKDKFSMEFRYDFDRGIVRAAPFASEFKNVSLILGYTIL